MGNNIINSEEYESAITQWIIKFLREKGITETHFSRNAGLGKNEKDARTFRKLKEGKRHWSIVDICKVASFFNETPSQILEKVEDFFKTEGIVRPGITTENLFSMGFAHKKNKEPLILTWQKRGKNFELVDCDSEWKKATKGELSIIIGLSSKEIFKPYPEVTETIENALKNEGTASLYLWYGKNVKPDQKNLQSTQNKRLISIDASFAPPNIVVAYAKDVTREKNERKKTKKVIGD